MNSIFYEKSQVDKTGSFEYDIKRGDIMRTVREEEVFRTVEEAQAECDKRNADIWNPSKEKS